MSINARRKGRPTRQREAGRTGGTLLGVFLIVPETGGVGLGTAFIKSVRYSPVSGEESLVKTWEPGQVFPPSAFIGISGDLRTEITSATADNQGETIELIIPDSGVLTALHVAPGEPALQAANGFTCSGC